jgi:hypothetical protein
MYDTESNNITPDQIKKLAEEMKKINKTIDLKNPLISELGNGMLSTVLSESTSKESLPKETPLKERQLDVDSINKNKNIIHINENEKEKWKRMMNYNVFDDENKEL